MRSGFSLQNGNPCKVCQCIILISLIPVVVLKVETRNVQKSTQIETKSLTTPKMLIEPNHKRYIRSALSQTREEDDEEEEVRDYETTTTEVDTTVTEQSSSVGTTTDPILYTTTTVNDAHESPTACTELPTDIVSKGATPKPLAVDNGMLVLPDGYNNFEIPKLALSRSGGNEGEFAPVVVKVYLKILRIREIDESNSEIVLDMDMTVKWVDGQLLGLEIFEKNEELLNLDPTFLKKLWTPDIYIEETVDIKKPSLIGTTRTLMYEPRAGAVWYRMRLTVRLQCEMDYHYYPADQQKCDFNIRSYIHDYSDLKIKWLNKGVFLEDTSDPNFKLQVSSIGRFFMSEINNGTKECIEDGLKFTILAQRKLSFQMVQTYLPSVFFIVITWLCFLVPSKMVEARIGISMTTLLTLTSMFSSVRENTPHVSYVKAIDVWMVSCIFFVFLTLFEFTILVWIRSVREDALERKWEKERKRQGKQRRSRTWEGKNPRERTPSPSPSICSEQLNRYELIAEFIEKWAFLIFSIGFLAFNLIYWSWLLVVSGYWSWSVNERYNNVEIEDGLCDL